MAALGWSDRHNVCAFLDPTSKEGVEVAGVINFMLRSRIRYAISQVHDPYRSHVSDFWRNAEKIEVEGYTVLKSKVANREIIISRADIHRVLQLEADDVEGMITLNKLLVKGCFKRIGYTGDIGKADLNKACLSVSYKYLFHVIIHCLGPTKGGFDVGRETLQSAMVALILNRPYDFSGMIFHHMKENLVRTTRDKFLMYPRFVQMFIDDKLPNLVKNDADKMVLRHMSNVTLNRLKTYKGRAVPPTKRLIGHLINENYVAPPAHRWRNDNSDSDEEILVNPVGDSDDHPDAGGAGVREIVKASATVEKPPVHPGEERGNIQIDPAVTATKSSKEGDKGKKSVEDEQVNVLESSDSSDSERSTMVNSKTRKLIPSKPAKQKGISTREPPAQQPKKRKLPKLKDLGKGKEKKSRKKKKIEFTVKSAQASVTQTHAVPVSTVPTTEIITTTGPQANVPVAQALASLSSLLGDQAVMTVSTTPTASSGSPLLAPTPVNITFSLGTSSNQENEQLRKKVHELSTISQLLLQKHIETETKLLEMNVKNLEVCEQNKKLLEILEEQKKSITYNNEWQSQQEGKFLMIEGKQDKLTKKVEKLRRSKKEIVDFVVDLSKRIPESPKDKLEEKEEGVEEEQEEDDEEIETDTESSTDPDDGDD